MRCGGDRGNWTKPTREIARPARVERLCVQDLRSVTRYDRRDHGRGVVSWVYDYWNALPIEHGGVATSLELGVQVRGDWIHQGRAGGGRPALVRHGEAHHLDVGESFAVRFDGRVTRGTQVGFAIYLGETDDRPVVGSPGQELAFVDRAPGVDARFWDLCRALDADRELPSDQVATEVWAYIARRCEPVLEDPLVRGKRELEEYFDRELLIEHIAAAASMSALTFRRRFKSRYGMTPALYRTKWRLHTAGRLLWSRHDMSIRDIAEHVGMADISYFYRGFKGLFGSTPALYRERSLALTS